MKTYLKNLRHGIFSLIEGDMISTITSYYGEWSEVEVAIFRTLLSPTSNIIEVGANIGLHTVPIAQTAYQGKVICFEPQRIIFQQLCCNLALNNLTNVESYRLGVGDNNTRIEIESSDYETAWNYGSFSLNKGFSTEGDFNGNIQKEWIDVINLDHFETVSQLASLDLLKIDAEGFDIKVLQGAKQTIKRLHPAIFVEAQPHNAKELFAYLKNLNYRIFSVASQRYQEKNYYQATQVENGYDSNFLALPKNMTGNVRQTSILSLISTLKEIKTTEECDKSMPLLVLN